MLEPRLAARVRVSTRRSVLGVLGAAIAGISISAARAETATDDVLTEAKVLRDPDIPVGGNRNGDVSIVEFFDYNCPYCRKLEPELQQVVQDDGRVRLILKDWPI